MFLDDAQLRTDDWIQRHSIENRRLVGVRRWKGITRFWHRLMPLVDWRTLDVLDFGGADGPLDGADICDCQPGHKWRHLSDIPAGYYDTVFTSHALEHVLNLDGALAEFGRITNDQGAVIVHVPAWTCERWRHTVYQNPDQDSPHVHTFCLWGTSLVESTAIDQAVARVFPRSTLAAYVGDNSILIIAHKRIDVA